MVGEEENEKENETGNAEALPEATATAPAEMTTEHAAGVMSTFMPTEPSPVVKKAVICLGECIMQEIDRSGGDPNVYFGNVKRMLKAVETISRVSTLDDDQDDDEVPGPFGVVRPRRRPRHGGLVADDDGRIGGNPMGNMVGQMVDAMAEHMPQIQRITEATRPPSPAPFVPRLDPDTARRYTMLDRFHMVREMLNVVGLTSEERTRYMDEANALMEELHETDTQPPALPALSPGVLSDPGSECAILPPAGDNEEDVT